MNEKVCVWSLVGRIDCRMYHASVESRTHWLNIYSSSRVCNIFSLRLLIATTSCRLITLIVRISHVSCGFIMLLCSFIVMEDVCLSPFINSLEILFEKLEFPHLCYIVLSTV